jgi:hypothetical protein
MSMSFYFNNPCHSCGRPTMHATIDCHPTARDLAIRKFHCVHCGPIKTEVLSLKSPRRLSTHVLPQPALATLPIKIAR